MKGVVLAGGTGSRLFPLTKHTNKHLIAIGNRQMIFYPVDTLINGGVKSILIISSCEYIGEFCKIFGDKYRGANVFYKVQENASTVPDALYLAKDFIGHDSKFSCILGDNIFLGKIDFNTDKLAKVIAKTVSSGIEEYSIYSNGVITEKPIGEVSGLALTGCYVYPNMVFSLIRDSMMESVSDLNNIFLSTDNLDIEEISSYWIDAGTFERVLEINNYLFKEAVCP